MKVKNIFLVVIAALLPLSVSANMLINSVPISNTNIVSNNVLAVGSHSCEYGNNPNYVPGNRNIPGTDPSTHYPCNPRT